MESKRIFVASRIPLVLHSITNLLGNADSPFTVSGAVMAYSGTDDLILANSDAAIIHICPQTELQVAIDFLQMLHRDFGLKVIVLGDRSDRVASELAAQEFISGFVDHFVLPDAFKRQVTEILDQAPIALTEPIHERKAPRLEVNIPVRLDGQVGQSSNISATGLYLQIDGHKTYHVGEEVEFEIDLELPTGESVLISRGQIVRTEELGKRLGIAIKINSTSMLPGHAGKRSTG